MNPQETWIKNALEHAEECTLNERQKAIIAIKYLQHKGVVCPSDPEYFWDWVYIQTGNDYTGKYKEVKNE